MSRLDHELVARGMVRSRAQAKELLANGSVTVNGTPQKKASLQVSEADELAVSVELDHYVSRAAHKLTAAIAAFPDFASRIPGTSCIDVGASTGGFTQVLLEAGAQHVVALDVGHGQLAEPLKSDERVLNVEGLNVRDVISRDQLQGQPFDLLVSDLSFISLTLAMPHMDFLLSPQGHMVVLVKPQFEVGRERLGRTGVVSSAEQRLESIMKVVASARERGLHVHGLAWSPMLGGTGNHEYLLWLTRQADGAMSEDELARTAQELVSKETA